VKFSFNWLCELVDGVAVSPQELGQLVTMKTAECEAVVSAGDDSVIEIDNKSITHRPDLWGHHGLAREVAAITGGRLRDPARMELLPMDAPPIEVVIEDFELCPRYSALAFENVTVQPSPVWLQERLAAIGLNPISNIVDVTNYVMAELAQPLHAFDWDLLQGPAIGVRAARAGERIAAPSPSPASLAASTPASARAPAGLSSRAPISRPPPSARPHRARNCAPTPPCASRRPRTR
jgi:phenylalanyl-tRNA synthetase beta chain